MIKINVIIFLLFTPLIILLSGCSKEENTITGALIGAGTGALIGSAVGKSGGAVAGAAIGGVTGAMIGHASGER